MEKLKGQGSVEYALLLAFIVGVGSVLYNGNLADAIRSVFSNVNTRIEEALKQPLEAATTAKDIIERLRQGRYEGLAADELPENPRKTLEITSDSPEGQQLAKKLNIQTKQGDAWFARVYTNGVTVFTYYSADANKGKTYEELKQDYNANPSTYYTKETGKKPTTVWITEGYYNSRGGSAVNSGATYFENVPGYVGPSPSGNGMSINPTPTNNLK